MFLVTAALVVPALVSLFVIKASDCMEDGEDHPALRRPGQREHPPWRVFAEPALHIFAVAAVLFQFANAALLPLALNGLARRGEVSGFAVSATIIVPQIVTAVLAPWFGRLAQRFGRRPVLLIGFAAVPLRAALFAALPGAVPLVAYQALDGVSAAVFGLMLPLIAADTTRRTGYLNLAIGSLGLAGGLGATFSTVIAGDVAERFGESAMFLFLATVAASAVLLLWLAMPETRPVPRRKAVSA